MVTVVILEYPTTKYEMASYYHTVGQAIHWSLLHSTILPIPDPGPAPDPDPDGGGDPDPDGGADPDPDGGADPDTDPDSMTGDSVNKAIE